MCIKQKPDHSVRLMLEYFHPWPNSAGFYYARLQGWYEEMGMDLHIELPDPWHGDSLEHLIRGRVDFAVAPTNRLLVRRERGERLVALAAINQLELETIQTLREKNILRPRHLVGRRLAMNPTPRGLAMIRHLVTLDGGNFDDVQIVDAGTRELRPEDLRAGLADASFGGYWAWETLMDSDVPEEERIVWPVRDIGAPAYHSYVLCARQEIVEKSPAVTSAFLQVTQKGFTAVASKPLAALPAYEQATPYLPSDLLARSLEAIAPSWLHEGTWGTIREPLMQEYTDWLVAHGILSDRQIWRDVLAPVLHPGSIQELV